MSTRVLDSTNRKAEVTIVDTSPREGSVVFAKVGTSEKIALANRLIQSGLRKLECAAFTHPRLTPAYADAESVVGSVERVSGVDIIGIAPNETACRRALSTNVDEIGLLVAASESFNQSLLGASIKQTIYKTFPAVIPLCREKGLSVRVYLLTAFWCHYEGRIPLRDVTGLASILSHLGVHEISLVDTPGMANPRQVQETVRALLELGLDVRFAAHFHNTRGFGLANCLAAYDAGVRIFDAAIGGLSGSPFGAPKMGLGSWNVPTEDLVCLFHESGVDTGISPDAIIEAAEFAQRLIGQELAGHAARARKAFKKANLTEVPEGLSVAGIAC